MWLALLACTSDPQTDPSATLRETGEREGGLTLEGRITDSAGQSLAEAVVQACASVCVAAFADDEGSYRVDGLFAGSWSIHAAGPSEDHAQLVIPWVLDGDDLLDLVIPDLGAAHLVTETPSEAHVADGLVLSLSSEWLPGVTDVRAARLPAEMWPDGLSLPAPPTVGWSIAPFGAGMAIPFQTTGHGRAYCSSKDGLSWEICDTWLPDLGSIVLVEL